MPVMLAIFILWSIIMLNEFKTCEFLDRLAEFITKLDMQEQANEELLFVLYKSNHEFSKEKHCKMCKLVEEIDRDIKILQRRVDITSTNICKFDLEDYVPDGIIKYYKNMRLLCNEYHKKWSLIYNMIDKEIAHKISH